jgi:hypothetical protein
MEKQTDLQDGESEREPLQEGVQGKDISMPEMEPLRLHEDSRQQLRLLADLNGCRFRAHASVMPSPAYRRYPTVFMSAMQPDLAWLYQGDVPDSIPTAIGTSFCIRTNHNFRNAGRNNLHLKCFEMLWVSGRMAEANFHDLTHRMLENQLHGSDAILSMKIHPDDEVAKRFCIERGLSFTEDETSVFDVPEKTDRKGKKAEWFATKRIGDEVMEWELMDAITVLSRRNGDEALDPPLVEAGGSFERILALREGVRHVLLSSAFDVRGLRRTADSHGFAMPQETALPIQDLIRPLIIMQGSGYTLPISHRTASKQEKAYYALCHELALTVIEHDVPPNIIAHLIEHDAMYLRSWEHAGYDGSSWNGIASAEPVLAVLQKIQERYAATFEYMRRQQGILERDDLIRRAADLYFGGTTRLAEFAAKKLFH